MFYLLFFVRGRILWFLFVCVVCVGWFVGVFWNCVEVKFLFVVIVVVSVCLGFLVVYWLW